MIKKEIFILTVAALSVIVITQMLIIIRPFNRREVISSEDAILIAKAELVRRYGREEILGKEFCADRSGKYWYVKK